MPAATSAFAEEHRVNEKKFDRRESPNSDGVEVASTDLQDHRKLEKAILRKLDIRIIPLLALLFLFSFLDRTNIGNAATLGLRADLGLSNHQYGVALTVYYLFYILSEIPSNLVLKVVSPRIWLPVLTAAWGICCLGLGFVRSYASLTVVRSLLGITEGGLLPGIVLYLSMIYTRREMGFRMGLIYGSASLSGAFGGLLAFGFNAIGPKSSVVDAGWRWIFILEGILTVVVAIICYVFLPNSVETAPFLTEAEQIYATQRLQRDRPMERTDGADGAHDSVRTEGFQWSEVKRGFFSVQTWLSASGYFSLLCGLYSFGLFVPSIVTGLGYSSTRAQLFSVPPYAVACVVTVIVAYVSDRLWLRGPVILVMLPIAIAGYAMISTVDTNSARYGALFLMATGMYSTVPAILVWLTGNSAGHYKRATVSALQLAIANCGGFVAAWIYPTTERPAYRKSHHIILGLLCYAWLAFALNLVFVRWVNKRKQDGAYDKFAGSGDDRDPKFKLTM
ncbi:MFS general substrate transporter [Cystobasidium minutum MCA 4210]|uniref:MFS general substrate transporter n=1 Tax=Cystobasidium minutum MCA 4210 TaxID=1397322 RepID=UPI0034CE4F71|eukprot:jgi/Rhomi1/44871/CE44870_1321